MDIPAQTVSIIVIPTRMGKQFDFERKIAEPFEAVDEKSEPSACSVFPALPTCEAAAPAPVLKDDAKDDVAPLPALADDVAAVALKTESQAIYADIEQSSKVEISAEIINLFMFVKGKPIRLQKCLRPRLRRTRPRAITYSHSA